jgi:hypothetical protein
MLPIIISFFKNLLPKLVVSFMLFGIGLFGTAMITGTVTSLRDIDANLGLLKRNKAPGYDLVDKKIMDEILGKKPIKVHAEDVGDLVGDVAIDAGVDLATSFIEGLIPNCFSFYGFSQCRNLTDKDVNKAVKAANKATTQPETAKALNTTLSGHFNNIVSSITRKVTGRLMTALTKDIMVILKDAFSVFDKYVKILEGLADNYSGTRIAIGYLIYRDIEGVTGRGGSNFLSSDQFTKSMLTSTGTNSSFPDKNYLLRVVTDGVAWLDFMNVQRFSQYDLIGDAYQAKLINSTDKANIDGVSSQTNEITEQSFFTQMENSIDRAILGVNCQNSNSIFNVPVIGNFAKGGVGNPCQFEQADAVKQALRIRQEQIRFATQTKLQQYQITSPVDCRARGYFNVVNPDKEDSSNPGHKLSKDTFEINYNKSNPGTLGRALAISASQIERIDISASECETFKTIQQRKAEYAASQTGNVNNQLNVGTDNKVSIQNKVLGALVGKISVPQVDIKKNAEGQQADKDLFQQFVNTSVQTFNDFAKPLFAQFDLRFKTLLEAGAKILDGGAAGQKLRNSIDLVKNQIGAQVRENLDYLNDNYQKYREQILNIKETQNNTLSFAGDVLSNVS